MRALLSVPAASARAAIPELRRALFAAGNAFSPAFWVAAERLLRRISAGEASVGEVRRWLQSSGSEPIDLIAEGFAWAEENERGPVGSQIHALLVSHLEGLVAEGTIDPDRLLAEDSSPWTEYERLQTQWLHTPLPDGREPIEAVSDEEDEEFLAAWDDAEADACAILAELLAEAPPRACPRAELRAACERLRAGLRADHWPYDLLRDAAGVAPETLPAQDTELWLTLAAGVVTCQADPQAHLDEAAHAAWIALMHPDWIGAVVTLVRGGVGTPADADSLAQYAATFDFEESDDPEADDETDDWDDEDLSGGRRALAVGFSTVELLWFVLGALDDESRLTALGWWGLPEALPRAWAGEATIRDNP